MIIVKCILAGVISLVVAAITLAVWVVVVLIVLPTSKGGITIAFDPAALAKSRLAWFIAFAVFALGFYWESKRITK